LGVFYSIRQRLASATLDGRSTIYWRWPGMLGALIYVLQLDQLGRRDFCGPGSAGRGLPILASVCDRAGRNPATSAAVSISCLHR